MGYDPLITGLRVLSGNVLPLMAIVGDVNMSGKAGRVSKVNFPE